MRISQREARRLRKRVEELELADSKRRNAWISDWPGGVYLTGVAIHSDVLAQVKTARKLGHAVVVVNAGDALQFYACKLSNS